MNGTPVKLSEILNSLDLLGDDCDAYLDTKTGGVVFVMHEDARAVEEGDDSDEADKAGEGATGWQQEALATARAVANDTEGQFVDLLSKYDLDEYDIMDGFCRTLEHEEASNELSAAIRGGGDFRRFKDAIQRLSVAEKYVSFSNIPAEEP